MPLAGRLEALYGSHEAFTRAFRDRFQQTPESVRECRSVDGLALVGPLELIPHANVRFDALRQPGYELFSEGRRGTLRLSIAAPDPAPPNEWAERLRTIVAGCAARRSRGADALITCAAAVALAGRTNGIETTAPPGGEQARAGLRQGPDRREGWDRSRMRKAAPPATRSLAPAPGGGGEPDAVGLVFDEKAGPDETGGQRLHELGTAPWNRIRSILERTAF